VVLTEKDFPSKPIIRKPRTFNPLGGVFFALTLGGAHILLNNSLVEKNLPIGFSIFGFLLIIIGMFFTLVASSLSSKYAIFITRIDKARNLLAQTIYQILLFYMGFVPIYGFTIVYGAVVSINKIIFAALAVVLIFSIIIGINTKILLREKVSLGYLQQITFQPNKLILILLSTLPSIISSLVFLLI